MILDSCTCLGILDRLLILRSFSFLSELVVARLSTKMGHSGGIESTGRVQVGDVITGIAINNEKLQYLGVGSKKTQRERASNVYSTLKQAKGQVRLQVERYKDEVCDTILPLITSTALVGLAQAHVEMVYNRKSTKFCNSVRTCASCWNRRMTTILSGSISKGHLYKHGGIQQKH